jgi:hypothetical protein
MGDHRMSEHKRLARRIAYDSARGIDRSRTARVRAAETAVLTTEIRSNELT